MADKPLAWTDSTANEIAPDDYWALRAVRAEARVEALGRALEEVCKPKSVTEHRKSVAAARKLLEEGIGSLSSS